jgi:two-component system response regulator YesN
MEKVDLVLTDIQMDGMSGIELMESVLGEKPDIPVVVISAHDEFEYAQKCIRLGARDYLIKPVLLPQLLEVVSRELTARREKYNLLIEDALKLKFSMASMASLRTYVLNEMLAGAMEATDDYEFIFEQIGVQLRGPDFAVFVLDLLWGDRGYSLRDRNLLKYAAVNVAEETMTDWNAVAFYGQGNRVVLIVQFDDAEPRLTTGERIAKLNLAGKTLVHNLNEYLHLEAIVGISSLKRGLAALTEAYRDAADAAKWHGVYDNHHVFFAEDFTLKKAQLQVDWQDKCDRLMERLRLGKREEETEESVRRFVEDIAPVFEREDATAGVPLSIAYRVFSALLAMQTTVGEGYKALDPLSYFVFPMNGAALKRRMTDFLLEAARLIRTSMEDQDQALVAGAVGYIGSHFRNKGLKIQDIADHVHLSPNYLSYLFKLVAKETVWEYVTRLRMEEANRLLLHTAKKRYEIADEVGYESPEHFSRVFKRFFGKSPNAVRPQ